MSNEQHDETWTPLNTVADHGVEDVGGPAGRQLGREARLGGELLGQCSHGRQTLGLDPKQQLGHFGIGRCGLDHAVEGAHPLDDPEGLGDGELEGSSHDPGPQAA